MSRHDDLLLEVEALHAGYGHVRVLQDVSMTVKRGELVALVGSNGAGKSTLLRTISGLLKPTAGSIRFGGGPIGGLSPIAIVRLGLQHVAEGRRLFRTQTVMDNLELGLWGARADAVERERRLEQVFQLFPILRERRQAYAAILSGGQQQMLAVAQAMMQRPQLLMLDEPSLGLAPAVIDQLLDAVLALKAQGTTVLLVEQMVDRALQMADSAYVMQNGKVIGHGPAAQLRGSELIRQAYLGNAGDSPAGAGAAVL
jgi:branched-chain amino acid transport system ATP-binding protein